LYSIAFSAFVLRALQSAPELHDARNSILNLIDPTCALDKSIITLPEMLTELAPLLQNPRLFDNTEHFHRLKSLCNKEKKERNIIKIKQNLFSFFPPFSFNFSLPSFQFIFTKSNRSKPLQAFV